MFKPIFIFCLLITLVCIPLWAQVNENFNDGNYTINPTWEGDTSKFDVNPANELWLNGPPVTDVAFLGTSVSTINNAEWQFYVRMDFNPSSANFCRYYLVSDQKNFNSPELNGYYVELGRINDEISLYYQSGTTVTKIIDGADNLLNTAACTTRVKVTRTGTLWELLADTTGGTAFVSLGTTGHALITENYFTGIYCKYTSTRSDKFFFDDVIITGADWPDMVPPSIVDHTVNLNLLDVSLNEMVRSSDYQLGNFSLDNGLNIINVKEDSLNSKQFQITASGPFLFDVLYHLSIDTLHDVTGNVSAGINYPFIIHPVQPGEVVINEVMADPAPAVNLPDAEYIEIYNQSNYPIQTTGWTLEVDGVTDLIPSFTLQPGDYVILADDSDTGLFASSILKIPIATFQSLTNAGANITLLDSAGTLLDMVEYHISWYQDAVKDDGGYSLERINPLEFCMQASNWIASNHSNGGTPGAANSVLDTNEISIAANVLVIDSLQILVIFNQQMDTSTFVNSNFVIPNLQSVVTISADSCLLILNVPLVPNTIQTLIIDQLLSDCSGNYMNADTTIQLTYYIPQLFDVLLNELMVDESPAIGLPLAEYIELYNTTVFNIPLNGCKLVVNGDSYILGNAVLPANGYLVLVDQSDIGLYGAINVLGIPSFNGLTNESGVVELYHSTGDLFHATKYHIDFYDNSAKENGGWSLEMIDINQPCIWNSNWTASTSVTGGTPGLANASAGVINDNRKPHLIRTGLIQPDTVLLYFDEPVHPQSLSVSDFFMNSNTVDSIHYYSPLLDQYWMKLQNPVVMDSMYQLVISSSNDCAGNIIITDTLFVAVPVFPNNFDVIVNEILFDPLSNCIDFVEIYNRGNKAVDLSWLILGEGDTNSFLLNTYVSLNTRSALLFPGEHMYISENNENVMSCYPLADSTHYWNVESLPDFANTNGIVGISTYNQQWLDMFAYNDDMHFSALNSVDGVSLERLDPNAATQSSMNWHSAASSVGYGTPGYRNSQFSPDVIIIDDFTVQPEIFSPDNDGYQDYVTIHYVLDAPGYLATLRIYDQAGRLEKNLVNNELLGTTGSFVWDGTNEQGAKVNVGIHIIYFELINLNGETIQFKKPVVVATKF